jgi:tetratricopeptide (TPR) repeat protein
MAIMKKSGRIPCIVLTVLSALLAFSCRSSSSSGAARIEEHQEMIKTYPFSDPDPVPIFARSNPWGRGARLYPYFSFDQFSAVGSDKPWTVVRMENPFLSVAVLPQVGGKVWGALEKSTGREFLYTNHVMKFRQIAMRGPWTSGGIEFNFGLVGHAPSTGTPVDYIVRRNADGSVSCIVGGLDLPSRTRWSVTIKLARDKAYFETNGAWYNPTPFSQSYYYWSCAAIKTGDDLKYIFPGRFQIGHDYSVPLRPWPVDEQGRDLSWYRNNAFGGSKSYFTVGEYNDFYGAWYQNSDSGFGHWALYDDMPGHKVWIWDESRAGEIWVDLLTDKDGQYSEPQAGRLLNQSDHEFFKPNAADRWQEIWFSYKDIGPMVKSSPTGVLSAEAAGHSVKVGLFALEAIDEDLVVRTAKNEIYRERLKLEPGQIFKKNVPIDSAGETITVAVGNTLVYQSDPTAGNIERPLHFKAVDETTAEGLYLSGMRLEKERLYPEALQKYLACLAKEPVHLRALARTAELYTRRGEYQNALTYAQKALENNMYDPEANFAYAIISRHLGNLVDAKETLGWAARSMEFRSSAYVQLAEIALSENKHSLAVEYGRRAVDFNKFNIGGYDVQATALRKLNQAEAANKIISQVLDIDPLDHLARFEAYLLQPSQESLEAFKLPIRNELPHENYLEMALYYIRIGCDEDAVLLLKNAPEYVTVYYWLALLLKDKSPGESRAYLTKASGFSPALVFPFREEEIPLFMWAMIQQPQDWKPKYYLGLIYSAKGRVEETQKLFEECDNADFAPFFLARGSLYRELSPGKASADFEKAVQMDGKNWRSWHALIDFELKRGKPEKALEDSRKAAELFPEEVPIQIDVVKAAISSRRFQDAAAILDKVEALPYEGASEIQGLYAETHIQLGLQNMRKGDWAQAVESLEKSKEYPERLGTGEPFDPDFRKQDYLESVCCDKLGQRDKAREALKSVSDYTLRNPDSRGPNAYYGGLALQKLGEPEKARKILEKATLPPREILDLIRR